MLLEATRWTHLPVGGGWYDQHPTFMDEIMIVFDEKAKWQKRDQERMDREQNSSAARNAALRTGIPVVH